jgi:hypothetical protein
MVIQVEMAIVVGEGEGEGERGEEGRKGREEVGEREVWKKGGRWVKRVEEG